MKTTVIACVNHKGGVAKTTSLVNLAAGLARFYSRRVCIIDADAQANSTIAVLGDAIQTLDASFLLESVLSDIIHDRTPPVKPLPWVDKVDIIPASLDLAAVEVMMNTVTGREFLFKELVGALDGRYDYILVDCPPSLGVLTQNALVAADYVLIPTDGNYFAMKGIEKIHYIISLLKRKLGAKAEILGYFMTKYNGARKLDADIRESLARDLGRGMLDTVIRNNVALGEAQYRTQSIFDYAPSSNGAKDYEMLVREIMGRMQARA